MSTTRTSPRAGRASAAALGALGVLAALSAACGSRAADVADRPAAEFLLSAGDSTFWVTSAPAGVRVRASSMFIARFGGRTYEVYATDDDRSYYDAVFTSQRIYRRDLIDGDSLPVFDDALVPSLARRYASAHPHEAPLAPDEETAERPRTTATTEVSLVDVHGPYLTYDARADVDAEGGGERHTVRRMVVDLRSARAASLTELFGAAAAESLVVAGRRQLAGALDSVRALADPDDEAGARALHALPSFRFVADNFGLADHRARPAVAFVAVGRDVDGHAVTLPLPPVVVPGAPPSWWDADVRAVVPTVPPDSAESRWTLAVGDVVARRVGGQEAAALTLHPPARGRGRAWPLVRVPTPVRQLYALDRAALDPTARRALARAFNESALYGGEATSAAYRPARTSRVACDRRTSRRAYRRACTPETPRSR